MPYADWFKGVFGVDPVIPTTRFYSTFDPSTPWGDKLHWAMLEAENDYARHLLEELDKDGIPGILVEFGIYRGGWVNIFCEHVDASAVKRNVWGFDSFEGLPELDEKLDETKFWTKGMYAADYETVCNYLRLSERSYLHLEKGWFCDTLKVMPAQSVDKVAYARIDGDLYSSCVDCLAFLDGRLSDGAILVFDDWLFDNTKGEPLAFAEWLEAGANGRYSFEVLEMMLWGHLYLRVRAI